MDGNYDLRTRNDNFLVVLYIAVRYIWRGDLQILQKILLLTTGILGHQLFLM
jgi:hypothetical protein